ncbi:MAG: hypothetical protein UX61_C0009G0009 [Parcubacteria group bacterium GW2011_GWA2_46_7]|nr:MAG: hypothetical protein UX15_C0019G0009 [Parcubacteria group bacterium GW2011_GWA1_45_7]KKU11205.1 MAG: hypothetical protein UX14_C0001G0024 [Parcubacteria group bacterium GW2011_GWF1_45_5]KKU43870.1 MAG: hypothetical protein UX61_C0009G0009 [Parcubacteria group bacterium GW2011_GWA2_46_7]KKU47849.1 MAG: hypothetical protein UX66_C0004G0012 [Parcubacteria group bacterium GW2011_GWF2_46_8]
MVKKVSTKIKEYVLVYQSQEHYEVLGYVRAPSMIVAKKRAQKKLLPEAKYYNVPQAEIDEIAGFDRVDFDLK